MDRRMKEATGRGGGMCRRGGGVVDLFATSPNPGSTASYTNTICHHSHLESAAWTSGYRRNQQHSDGSVRTERSGEDEEEGGTVRVTVMRRHMAACTACTL
ncbi:hypothetical protein Q8A73_020260 [Channa argus]|nr:hypothetical protein Q8A73_020260 [Channa argus]